MCVLAIDGPGHAQLFMSLRRNSQDYFQNGFSDLWGGTMESSAQVTTASYLF